MEKSTPHYNLVVIKEYVMRLGEKAFTRSARIDGKSLGLNFGQIQDVIFGLHAKMLHKSMTT